MSLSTGSGGTTLFLIPSRPAIKHAENARYGLAAGSGDRNSTRLVFGLVEYIGMRRDVLDHVLVAHHLVAHLGERVESHVDLRLSGGPDLVVLHLHAHPGLDQLEHDLGAEVFFFFFFFFFLVALLVPRAEGKV